MVMVRAFIALELSQAQREAMARAQEALRGCQAKLTLVDPAIIHITLKFLGEVDEQAIPDLAAAMKSVRFSPYELRITGIRGNNPYRPRVIWCEAEDAEKTRELNALLESALEPLGIEKEDRPFRTHATLARVRVFHPSLLDRIRSLADFRCDGCTITGMKLKKSTLTPHGPVYEDIAEAVF